MKRILTALILSSPISMAAETRFAGTVKNTRGEPIAALTIHFYRQSAAGFDHLTAITGPDGHWHINLPDSGWRGAANTDDLLARGYFCFPGFCCGGGETIGFWPPLWGPGAIEWSPVILPGAIDLTVVPTRPELSLQQPKTPQTGIKVSFETTTATMATVRQWRIEKSADLQSWTAVKTVALSGSSPVIVPDPASANAPVCYYRAVQVEDIVAGL